MDNKFAYLVVYVLIRDLTLLLFFSMARGLKKKTMADKRSEANGLILYLKDTIPT